MNTHSTSRQNRMGISNRFAETSVTASSRPVYRVQKRQKSKSHFPHSTVNRKPVLAVSASTDDHLRQQALAEAQAGNSDRAVLLFTQIIERNPNSATDYNNRGLAYFQGGQQEAAIADYNTALRLNPSIGSIYNNRANYYAAQGQLLDAILDYNTAIEIDPGNIRAWINQGITFRDLQMYDRAIECFDLALTLNRLEGHVYAERGRAYHLQGDWNGATADYRRAVTRLPLPTQLGTSNPSVRLRLQVEVWIDDLLSPLQF